jgi:hypothetical protein
MGLIKYEFCILNPTCIIVGGVFTLGEIVKEIKVDESYESFENIDCFENACNVVDSMLKLLKNDNNPYWEKFITKIPKAYYSRNIKDDPKEELLYLVCSNAFYIIDLFEHREDEDAVYFLEKCEQECC